MTRKLVEVLAARYRLGEHMWTFSSRVRRQLGRLELLGWIGWKSGIVERTYLAWFTEAGLAAALSADYAIPIDALRAELAAKDQAINDAEILHQTIHGTCPVCFAPEESA